MAKLAQVANKTSVFGSDIMVTTTMPGQKSLLSFQSKLEKAAPGPDENGPSGN